MNTPNGIRQASVKNQRNDHDSIFPYVFGCDDAALTLTDFVSWVSASRDDLLTLASQHGAVAFRGFPTPTVEDFDAFVQASNWKTFPMRNRFPTPFESIAHPAFSPPMSAAGRQDFLSPRDGTNAALSPIHHVFL